MDNEINIKDIHLDGLETWDLKVSLYDNYWTIIDAWHKKGHKGKCIDGDLGVMEELAHKLFHTSMKEITDEIDSTGISEYD